MAAAASLPPTTPASMSSSQTNFNGMGASLPNNTSGMGSNTAPSPRTTPTPTPATQRTYTQEDFTRFARLALAAAYSEQMTRQQDANATVRSPRTLARTHTHPYMPRSASLGGLALASAAQQQQQNAGVMKPRMHLYESTSEGGRTMVATLELPGLARADVNVTARPGGELVIAGERHEARLAALAMGLSADSNTSSPNSGGDNDSNDNGSGHAGRRGRTVFNELKFGRFQRCIRLPPGTDPRKITASMDDGMLTISWPLPEASSQPDSTTSRSPSPTSNTATSNTANENGREGSRNGTPAHAHSTTATNVDVKPTATDTTTTTTTGTKVARDGASNSAAVERKRRGPGKDVELEGGDAKMVVEADTSVDVKSC